MPAPEVQDESGSGGVSIFAAQIATALGAKVIATSSKDENLQAVKKLGAVAGGDGINQSIAATKAGGRIAQIGFLTGQTSALNLMPTIFRQTNFRGIAVAPRSSFDRMNVFLNEHKIRPVIDHVYPSSRLARPTNTWPEGDLTK
ncbi:putative alcohol dehydrogenase [Pseudomonas coronafaciens pv. atropurpurea]|nr:putative alcohol dehydrogenase [Pseudomonas coronafaciens pv. atropurpurea]